MLGLGLLSWAKIAAVMALIGALLYTVHDYKNLSVKLEARDNTIKTLRANIAAHKKINADTRIVIQQLDEACAAQAQRFLKESDIIRRIEAAEDPLTEAVNSVIAPEDKSK